MADFPLHEQHQEVQKSKKRRLHGACDGCRKRKIRCTTFRDSAVRPGSTCSNCEISSIPCTHDAPRQPKKKETQQAYIQSLEERLEKMERVFRVLHPDRDIETLLDMPLSEVSESLSLRSDTLTAVSSLKTFPKLTYPTPHLASTIVSEGSSPESVNQYSEVDSTEEEEDLSHVELTDHLNQMLLEDKRFFGQASSYMFAHYTMHAKLESSGSCPSHPLDSKMLRRPLYWEMRPWELSFARSQQNTLDFPEPDLLNSLVALYFEKSNIFIPVLHKPTFLSSLTSGLHHRDFGFGMTVLLVCSIASRFTTDTRVLLDDDISSLSAGWKYYTQVAVFRNRLFEKTTLYDLQCYVLSTVYLLGTSMIHVAWPMLGLGLRFAQEKGLHRRKGKKEHTAEEELEKRVFWSLIVIDRWMSAFLGRPCGMQDEEFDLDYPAECDDEYWETADPKDAFQQPPGKPCKISYFIWTIKLAEILGFALRTLYATKKSKMLIGLIGSEWESQAVTELDSSLNKWRDGIPHFLRWNPEILDATFFCQSVALHTCFYHLQMQIHRPFLMKRTALSFTSLAICNNAARSTAHILEAAISRGAALFPSVYMSAFTAALVLLLTHWLYQQTDSTVDLKTTMELVRKLFHALKEGEKKWHMAGRLCDLTQILGCLSDHRSNSQLKRRRESSGITDPPVSRSHHGAPWEKLGVAEETLLKQIAASNLDPPAVMQTAWETNDFCAPQMGHGQYSHPQSFMTSQVIEQVAEPASFVPETNFQSSPSSHAPHLFDTHPQEHCFADELINPVGLDWSNDLIDMWANVPMNFSSHEWANFLSDAMQPPVQ